MRAALVMSLVWILSVSNMNRWFELGKEIGLTGTDLADFIKERECAGREQRVQNLEQTRNEIDLKRHEKEVLDLQLRLQNVKTEQPDGIDESRVMTNTARTPKLPVFDESKDDLDAYLQRFERYAASQGWDEDHWATCLSALLRGKALDVYSRLPLDDASDYGSLKSALLKRFRMTEEGFRCKFRSARSDFGETPSQFSVRLENYFLRWIDLAGIDKTFEGVKDILLREQFINSCSRELALFLKERMPRNIQTMTKLAEQYQEAHGSQFGFAHQNRRRPQAAQGSHQSSVAAPSQTSQKPVDKRYFGRPQSTNREQRTCFICNRKGHIATDCHFKSKPTKVGAMLTGSKGHPSTNWQKRGSQGSQPAESTTEVRPQPSKSPEKGRSNTCDHCHQPVQSVDAVACMMPDPQSIFTECCSQGGVVKLKCGHELPILCG